MIFVVDKLKLVGSVPNGSIVGNELVLLSGNKRIAELFRIGYGLDTKE